MFLNNITSVNEVYFGKTPSIQKIEKQLDVFRNKYMDSYLFNIHVNSDPDLLTLNRMFEDQFGFGCFSLNIINEPIVNACTSPIDARYDIINTNKNLIANKKTFKFNKDADYACIVYIYSGVIFNPEFTTEEVMVTILHEVGHNFYAALDSKHGVMSNLYSAISLIYDISLISKTSPVKTTERILSNTNFYKSLSTKFYNYLRANKSIITTIDDYINLVFSCVKTGIYSIGSFIDITTLGFLSLFGSLYDTYSKLTNPFSLIFLPMNYTNERLADNFPTMYGYGPATISVHNKFNSNKVKSQSNIKNSFNNVPILSNLYSINNQISKIVVTAFDEHPDEISRCYDQLKMLEREAEKTDLDPKMRKVILADCKACKDKLNKMVTIQLDIKDKDVVRNAYNKALYDSTNSKALKDMLLDDVNKFDTYDKTYKNKFSKED